MEDDVIGDEEEQSESDEDEAVASTEDVEAEAAAIFLRSSCSKFVNRNEFDRVELKLSGRLKQVDRSAGN